MRVIRSILFLCALVSVTLPVNAAPAAKPADIPVAAFAQLPVMRSPRLSPDGSHLAYLRPVDGRAHLVIQTMIGSHSTPVVVPPVGDLDFRWLEWANTDRLVFVISATRQRGIRETIETRLWAIDKDGSNAMHIVQRSKTMDTGSNLPRDRPNAQIQSDVIHWLPDEPHHILLALDGDQNGADEVRRIDIRTGDYKLARDDYPGIQSWLTDASGQLRLGWGYSGSAFRVLTLNDNGRWARAEKASWWDERFFPSAFTASPNVLYTNGRNSHGMEVVRTMDVTSGKFLETIFEREGIDAGSLVLDPLTHLPVGVSYVEHEERVHYFDDSLAALQRAIDAVQPTTVNRIVSMTADRRKVLIHSASDIDPGAFSFLNRDKNTLSFVAEAMPGLAPELMSPVEYVSYESRDGVAIHGYLTLPNGLQDQNLPVIVMPHGGPTSRDDKSFWFLSQFLASRGYAVFQPNFRGSSGYGRSYERAGRKEWGGRMQEDVTDGTRWLIDQGIADAERICIVGWSYGGYSAAIGAVQTPELYQCAASINGVLDLPRLINSDRGYIGGTVWTRHMGLEGEKAKIVSPYHQAERIQIPMLIIQARDDARVSLDQGKRMARRLRRLDKPHEYIEVEHGGHSMNNEAARRTILEALDAFLAANLGRQ